MRCIPNRAMSGNVHAIGSEDGSNRIRLFRLMLRMEVKFGTATGSCLGRPLSLSAHDPINLGAFLSRRIRLCRWCWSSALNGPRERRGVRGQVHAPRTFRMKARPSLLYPYFEVPRWVIPVFPEFEFWVRSQLAPILRSWAKADLR
jgi:hypothetical protein